MKDKLENGFYRRFKNDLLPQLVKQTELSTNANQSILGNNKLKVFAPEFIE